MSSCRATDHRVCSSRLLSFGAPTHVRRNPLRRTAYYGSACTNCSLMARLGSADVAARTGLRVLRVGLGSYPIGLRVATLHHARYGGSDPKRCYQRQRRSVEPVPADRADGWRTGDRHRLCRPRCRLCGGSALQPNPQPGRLASPTASPSSPIRTATDVCGMPAGVLGGQPWNQPSQECVLASRLKCQLARSGRSPQGPHR